MCVCVCVCVCVEKRKPWVSGVASRRERSIKREEEEEATLSLFLFQKVIS